MKTCARKLPAMLALLSTVSCLLSTVFAQGTAFTYQGQLQTGGAPAIGTYDLTFTLFTNSSGGTAVAGPVTNSGVAISNGLFTVIIDFGAGPWNGVSNWLEIAVETNGAGSFTTLARRQEVTPTPYAIFANTASNLSGTLPVAQLNGLILDSQLNHSAVTYNPGPGLSGGGRVGLGNTATFTNTGVLSVTGNADVTAATVNGAVTLGDTGTNTNTANTLVKRDGAGSFSAASITLDGSLTLPDLELGNPAAIFSGGDIILYSDKNGNFAGGDLAGNLGTAGHFNTAVGNQALEFNSGGSFNTAVGNGAMFFSSTGNDNTVAGYGAMGSSSGAGDNTAIGYQALGNNKSGSFNTVVGSLALGNSTNASDNTALGYQALYLNASGSDNTGIGYLALLENNSGSFNTAIGEGSLEGLTSGNNNIGVGYLAGGAITTGSGNIDIGNGGLPSDSNIIRIGSSQTQTYIAGVLLPPPPVLVQTNFIDGRHYTNTFGWPLTINATVVLNTAGVVGTANESLCIQASPTVGGATNPCAISTIAASIVVHYTNYLGGFVPTNAIYFFTNLSSGSGNSAIVAGGQIKYP